MIKICDEDQLKKSGSKKHKNYRLHVVHEKESGWDLMRQVGSKQMQPKMESTTTVLRFMSP